VPLRLDVAYQAAAKCKLFLAIGTGAQTPPVAELAAEAARLGAPRVLFAREPADDRALFSEFFCGIPGDIVAPYVEKLMRGEVGPPLR
jgi:NAD-dependent protein deacetylase/lipoamidase